MKIPENYKENCAAFVSEMVRFWPEAFDEDNDEPIDGADFLDTFMAAARENGLTFSGDS